MIKQLAVHAHKKESYILDLKPTPLQNLTQKGSQM